MCSEKDPRRAKSVSTPHYDYSQIFKVSYSEKRRGLILCQGSKKLWKSYIPRDRIDSAQVTRSDPRDFPAPRLYGLICMWWLEVKKKSCFEFLSREALTSGNSCLLRLKVHEHSWWGVAWGSVVDNWLNTMVLLNLYQSDWTFLTSWGREGRALACVAMLCMVWTN